MDPDTKPAQTFLPACRWNLIQFGLVCSYTMGLAAMWKFPYLVYRHTGLFLVAYYILLILICVPVTFLQLKLGAALGQGVLKIFSHYVPALKGVAVCILVFSLLQCLYYNVYIAYGFYYMFACFQQPFVWSAASNATTRGNFHFFGRNPAEFYYVMTFQERTASLFEPGSVPWHLGLCLFVTWVVTFLLICRGANWFGKVLYVSSPLSVLLLLTLLIYSHTAIPTAYKSLSQFFSDDKDEWVDSAKHISKDKDILSSELASPLTWIRALEQHLYCVGLWAGILPSLGSYLGNKKPASNLTWLLVLLVHSMLPHLGTIAIAPLVHALAVKKHMPFEDVIYSGSSHAYHLTFVVLPEAFATLNISPFWVFLYYVYFVLFALHQQALYLIIIIENLVQGLKQWAQIVFKRQEFLAAALCSLAFFLSLPHITQGGCYLTQILDLYLFKLLFLVVAFSVPPFILAYVRLETLHLPIERLCLCVWFAVASLVTAILLIYECAKFGESDRLYSGGETTIGWMIAVCPFFLCLTGGVIHALYLTEGSLLERFKKIVIPGTEPLAPSSEEDLTGGQLNGTLPHRKKARAQVQQQQQQQQQQQRTELEICIAPNGTNGHLAGQNGHAANV